MDKSPEKVRRLRVGLSYLHFIPEFILTIGLALGWYIRWKFYGHTILLLIGASGLSLMIFNLLLHYYFQIRILTSIFRLWVGCLLGVVSLFDISHNLQHYYSSLEDVVNLLLISSVISQLLVQSVSKCCRSTVTHNVWSHNELFELIGVGASCLMAGHDTLPLIVLLCAFGMVLTSIKLCSLLSCVNLFFLIFTSNKYLFPDLHMSVNPYGIIAFVARLSLPPILDLLISNQSRLEKWQNFILASRFYQRMSLFMVTVLEITVYVSHAVVVKNHKEWYVVVPLFVAASILWFLMHFVFLIVFGTLVNRFARCRDYASGLLAMKKVLAARGLRYFSLIAQRLVYFSIVSSILIGVLCWTTRTSYNFGLLAAVIAVETMIGELLNEFSNSLGGTCIGYGIVAPVVAIRGDNAVTILPPNFIQQAGNRSTRILQSVLDFFAQHMITNFGCDWSMAGVSLSELEKKLSDFFSQTTIEGPRYDSYLLYYSGPTTTNGDWALTDNSTISLSQLQDLWSQYNTTRSSRLILICDCESSHNWLKPLRRTTGSGNYFALQTLRYHKNDPELSMNVGEFTEYFVHFNSGHSKSEIEVQNKTFRMLYAVSRRWTDFNFHLPNKEETANYWMNSLPNITHPFMGVVITILGAKFPISVCCECCVRVMRRWRMKIWPPVEIDTGHGFKLMRS